MEANDFEGRGYALNATIAIPRGGDVVTLSFTAPAPGRYAITCSEYCGRGHDDMKSVLVVAPSTR